MGKISLTCIDLSLRFIGLKFKMRRMFFSPNTSAIARHRLEPRPLPVAFTLEKSIIAERQ